MDTSSPSPDQATVSPADLARVLGGEGLTTHYQPIVDLRRGTVVGYEALARFDAAERNPEVWFARARELGLGAALEAAAVRSALTRRANLPVNTFLTVNVGPDVLTSPEMQEVWASAESLAGVVIELTEQHRIESYVDLEPSLNALRAQGALVAIDDAGAGYAGLQHLLSLRPDFVKLDRGLVAGLDRDEAKRALVEMMGTFGSRVDAWLLAEGIETGEELDVLVQLGVPLGQGYFFGRPAAEFATADPDAVLRVLTQQQAGEHPGLRPLIEFAPTAVDVDAARVLLGDDRHDVVVMLDGHGRPSSTVDGWGALHAIRDSGLRMNVTTPLDEAAQRAIVRPASSRFHPIVCTDNAGRYCGIVRVERLLDALARAAAPALHA
ncbi:EAL domain-containing protein [Aeromicrobium sp. IC_218]|uniref:EAL domain-containing protein n=1 Tax=Aeromicrobium sp. IC_218 TaxID=2545468 RepID=UPI00103D6E7B|nr:EAL domain-containing protein [Aeromicrobium sp. IC_218]TCI98849.1 EAL domain-containing protein [Aeromicrobium sp. IC_218]